MGLECDSYQVSCMQWTDTKARVDSVCASSNYWNLWQIQQAVQKLHSSMSPLPRRNDTMCLQCQQKRINAAKVSHFRGRPLMCVWVCECVCAQSACSSRFFCDIMESMLFSCFQGESHKNHTDHIAVKRWITIYKRQDWSDSKLLNLYKNIMQDVLIFEKHHINHAKKRFAHNISQEFINNFFVKPEVWKQLQFAHISNFPQMNWYVCCFLLYSLYWRLNSTSCHASICLHCGYDAHQGLNCEENMKLMAADKATAKDIKETVEWKLENSRRCPNCSIMINRDEGCNKVDCSYCGFCFCWACRSSWADVGWYIECWTTA